MIVRISEDDRTLFRDNLSRDEIHDLIMYAKGLTQRKVDPHPVIQKVCSRYGFVPEELQERNNSPAIVKARALVYYHLIKHDGYTMKEAVSVFGQHRLTIRHALKSVENEYMEHYKLTFGEE